MKRIITIHVPVEVDGDTQAVDNIVGEFPTLKDAIAESINVICDRVEVSSGKISITIGPEQ